ncbi:MAG: acyl-CoA synthetase [Chloroflexi bacterium]|nr:acyl-CoA synthetase [Chloroflexota bacterium]
MAFSNFWTLAADHPSRPAVIEPSGNAVSAGDLLARANRLVHGLRAIGLQPGEAIAAVLPNSAEAYELYLAMQQAGWYLVPINFHLVGPEIAYILQDSEARVFVAHERFADACQAAVIQAGLPSERAFAVGNIDGFRAFDELKSGQPSTSPPQRTLGSVMNYTSGTTGRPKGVRRPLQGIEPEEVDLPAPLLAYGVTREEQDNVHLLACPWYHTAPLVMSIPSMHLGHSLVIMERFGPEQCLLKIQQYQVTITHLVPTQFVRMLALPQVVRNSYDVSSLRHVIHGAAPCSPDVKRRMIEWWGPVLDEYYNSTEGVGGTIIQSEEWLRKPGSVGKARGDNEFAILDDAGNVLPVGQIGTVYSKARDDFSYFKDPEKTARARRGPYATVGDVGYLDEDGYLYLCDRQSDMIISGGVNIYPAEVESVLITHPSVGDVAVFGVPNDEWGEEVKAVVEPRAGVAPSAELAQSLLEFCSGKMARYKLPRSIDFLEQLPRDPSGKLYKRKLRDAYWRDRERAI